MASIDIGAQAVQLLVAKLLADGRIEPINEYVAMTKLADAIPETGALAEDAMAKTFQAAKEMQDIAMAEGAVSLIVTASSVIREASNRSRFLLLCHQKLNIYPQLLSGKDEARLNFLGASQPFDAHRPLLALGIGGSSSQLAYGTKSSINAVASVNIGAATLERLYALGSSGSALKQKTAAQQIRKELGDFPKDYLEWVAAQDAKPLALVSGSMANSLAAMIRKQPIFDFKTLDLTPCSREELFEQYKRIARLKGKERLAIPGIDAEIEPYIVSGLFLLHSVLEILQADDFRTSSSGLRSGVLKYFMDSN